MSSYFDKKTDELHRLMEQGISPYSIEEWRESLALDILLFLQLCKEEAAITASQHAFAVKTLYTHMIIDWPSEMTEDGHTKALPGQPDPESDEEIFQTLLRGVNRLHDLFHEIGRNENSRVGDNPLVWRSMLLMQAEAQATTMLTGVSE